MKDKALLLYVCFVNNLFSLENNLASILSIENDSGNETVITVSSQSHIDYGLSYPITYEFSLPLNSSDLYAYRKSKMNEEWTQIEQKTTDDFFNGIEAARFDYDNSVAYVSLAFSNVSDSIIVKISDGQDNSVMATFSKISRYYDNRDAVVTATADDWAGWNNQNFIYTCENFRNLNLWLSCAVITDINDPAVWGDIQQQLDLGNIEVVSHSRTHPYIPYQYLESEVLGSKQDLIEYLDLPDLNRYGVREYIYAWIAPYGEYDEDIDTLTSFGKYLVSRLFYYNDHQFSDWDNTLNKFYPVGGSIEVGNSSWWGSTDIIELNNTFDTAVSSNGIYHLITHPNILEWDQDFTLDHLEYISNRKDIWYVGFGHLYLYRYLSNSDQGVNLSTKDSHINSSVFELHQNYPNPFNPSTIIRYDLLNDSHVTLEVYDLLGNQIKLLVNEFQRSGIRELQWDSTNNLGQRVSAGIYFYKVTVPHHTGTQKMILLK